MDLTTRLLIVIKNAMDGDWVMFSKIKKRVADKDHP